VAPAGLRRKRKSRVRKVERMVVALLVEELEVPLVLL